jgi:DnaJ-class molecular chaperone
MADTKPVPKKDEPLIKRVCPICKGWGNLPLGTTCKNCKGTGYVSD